MPETATSRGAILVTGGAGYIGAHACKALARAAWTPVTYDDLSTGHAAAVKWGPLEQGSLHDRARLDEVVARHRPQAVMHFAARSDVGESARDPAKYWRDNVAGSLTLIEAMLAGGVDRLVFSSTCAVYGDQDGVVLDESSETRPINSYASSKRAIEDMTRDFGASHGLRTVIFRYFNVAGADPEADVGEAHDPETHLVPLMLQAVAGKRPALTLHGTDYDTPDGTCIRDYVHVWDLIAAHVLGLSGCSEGRTRASTTSAPALGFRCAKWSTRAVRSPTARCRSSRDRGVRVTRSGSSRDRRAPPKNSTGGQSARRCGR